MLRAYATLMWAVLAGLVVAGATAVIVRNQDSEYVSRATMLIDQRGVFTAEGEGLVVKLSRLRVRYRDLVLSDTIAKPAAKRMKLPVGVVRSAVSAAVPPTTLTLIVTADTGDPKLSQRIARGVAAEIGRYADAEQEQARVAPGRRVTLKVVDQADGAARVRPSLTRALVTAALAGAIAFGVAYLALLLIFGSRPQRR